MKSEILTSPVSMKPRVPPQSPFQRAKDEWDGRIGSAVAQARNWRIAFMIMGLLTISLSAALIVQIHKEKVVPILVGLNPSTGEPTVLGEALPQAKKPGGLEVKYFLSEFIRYVRSVPLDQVMIKQNWKRAYSYLRKDAAAYLNELTQKDESSPLKKIGSLIVSVQPLSVVPIPDTDSFQVRWKESVFSSSGSKVDEYTMLGTFAIQIEAPTDEQMIQDNPLGIFIKSFEWNREL